MQVLGALIIGFVSVQLVLLISETIQQMRGGATQRRLSSELIRQRIAAANALRVRREQSQLIWNGVRKFVVDRRVEEADNVASFYLVPHDGKALPLFDPGQYLTFKLDIPGRDKPVIRCYSLSDGPNSNYYRVTIKRVGPPRDQPDAPPGLVSNYFLDHVKEGDILDVQAPRGNFTLDPNQRRSAVLIAGGIGVTPLISMVSAMLQTGLDQRVYFFYGVRNRNEHAMREFLQDVERNHENIDVYSCYSHPLEDDVEGRDYRFAERVSVPLLQQVLDSNNHDFYLCGPPPMMSSLMSGLQEWGVPKKRIFSEAFGPASGKAVGQARSEKPAAPADGTEKAVSAAVKVTFDKTGKTIGWDDAAGNLLSFANQNDVPIDSGCQAGSCGTCVVAIKSGRVSYVTEHNAELEDGTCLTCISVPDGDLVLDA